MAAIAGLLMLAVLLMPLPTTILQAVSLSPNAAIVSTWTVEPVGYFGGSAEPSLALDSRQVPYVLYCPPGDEEFATRTPIGWSGEHVVSTIFGGGCGQLAFGPGNIPHVTTLTAKGILKELYGVRVSGTWNLAPYPGGSLEAVNSRGEPQVIAFAWQGRPTYVWRYLTLAGGTWIQEDVEAFSSQSSFGDVWSSLVLDAEGKPHVLYYDDIRGDVRYAVRDSLGWNVEIVEHTGTLNIFGREGSLALDAVGRPYASYTVRTGTKNAEVRYTVRSPTGWVVEVVSEPPPLLGGRGQSPTLRIAPTGPVLMYRREVWLADDGSSLDEDLLYAARTSTGWTREVAYDGQFVLNAPGDPTDDVWDFAQFPTMVLDRCGNPHAAFYLNKRAGPVSNSGVYYATKGGPCETREVSLNVDPDTLNLKSRGQWVTATITLENATARDVDATSLLLNGVRVAWSAFVVNDTTLIAKFDRAAFAATLNLGMNVVTLTGRWRDGGTFVATDTIRVMRPGR